MGARPVGKFLGASFADQAHGFFNVARIGIALFDQAHGQAVGAEDEMDARAIGKLAEAFANIGDQGLNVERVIEEMLDAAFGEGVVGLAVDAAPFFEAAERGGVGEVRVERKENEFVEVVLFLDGGDSVFGKRLPVAHGGDCDGIHVWAYGGDEFGALAFSEEADGRAAADLAVALSYGRSAFFGDVAGEGAADEVERAERDDVRIEEEIAEEGLDGGEGVRAAELEEDDADAFFGLGSWLSRHGSTLSSLLGRVGWLWIDRESGSGASALQITSRGGASFSGGRVRRGGWRCAWRW